MDIQKLLEDPDAPARLEDFVEDRDGGRAALRLEYPFEMTDKRTGGGDGARLVAVLEFRRPVAGDLDILGHANADPLKAARAFVAALVDLPEPLLAKRLDAADMTRAQAVAFGFLPTSSRPKGGGATGGPSLAG
ncbi:MAG: phage tail assembly protein [Alphaproteobacteria bacterium]|nr:phage tail assembly protein [Alphaproteobacteria bacterium]